MSFLGRFQFSPLQQNDESFMLISSCKDGQPMLRDWTGDWVGTFLGASPSIDSAAKFILTNAHLTSSR